MTASQVRGWDPKPAVTIDVHHHFNPDLKDNEGNPWTLQMSLDALDRNSIACAVASLGPVNDFASAERPARVRRWNEWGARACQDYPGRFGLFASLPIPNIDLALKEIAYVYDILRVDGIGMSTSEGDIWISDDRNAPVFDELNRRNAVVFVHPAPTSNCSSLSRSYAGDFVTAPWLEFPTNTARAILGLLSRGTTVRFPNIRFIFCHGGGVMPLVLGRIAGFSDWRTVGPERLGTMFPSGIYEEFAKLYFECAQAYAPEAIELLTRLLPAPHLLFGSDFSYFPISHSIEQFSRLNLDEFARIGIRGANAAALFPRLGKYIVRNSGVLGAPMAAIEVSQ